ncbi:autotransporter outer membrane beta-barrel domain-containing protein [Aliarcobacter butzleri]|nr:autotransporter outer membrane beta-barrel domain-containing protein [Aliarcobacter butzleri]
MGAVLSKIDTLSTNNEVVKAINSIVPTTSFVNTSSQITSSVSNIISNRLGNIKSGLNSGDEIIVDSNRVWIKAFGSLGDQKDKDSISGFDLKTYGLGLGYDKEYKEDQIIGLATFYTNANVETNGVNHENDVDAYSIVAYGSNLLVDEKTTIYYQGSYTWQNNDSKRELFTGEQANADFTSKTVALDLKVGHKININDKFAVEPNIGTTYRHFTNPSYNESGAGALNIQSERFTSSEFIGNIGTDFEYKLTPDSKLTATIGAGYDFKDDDNIVTSSFAGASGVSFDTKGIDNGRWNYIAGVGYDVNLDSQNNLNLQYNYQGEGSKYSNNVISLNYMYKF